MDFKYAPYAYISGFFVFSPLLRTFLLSDYDSNNSKTILSPKRSKYQLKTIRYFLDKTKSHHFSFTTCFIIWKFILEYYLRARNSEPKQGIFIIITRI